MENKKISAIEGFRAVACFGIMLSHFVGSFYDWENMWFWNTPVQIIFAGDTFIRLFFTLSGLVVGYKYYQKKKYESIPWDIINRYIRMMPMVLLATFVTYLMMKGHLLYNQEAAVLSGSTDFLGTFNTFEPGIIDCLKNAFIGTFSEAGNAYIGAYWTMPYELFGVIISLGFIAAFKENRLRYIIYAVTILFAESFYAYFILGVMVSDLYFHEKIRKILSRNQYVNTAVLILAFYMLGMWNMNDSSWFMRILYYILTIVFLLMLITNQPADKILGNKIGRFLGRISFGIYSFHYLVIMSLSSYMYIRIPDHSNLTMVLNFIVMFAVTVCISYPATIFNERCGKAVNHLKEKMLNYKKGTAL